MRPPPHIHTISRVRPEVPKHLREFFRRLRPKSSKQCSRYFVRLMFGCGVLAISQSLRRGTTSSVWGPPEKKQRFLTTFAANRWTNRVREMMSSFGAYKQVRISILHHTHPWRLPPQPCNIVIESSITQVIDIVTNLLRYEALSCIPNNDLMLGRISLLAAEMTDVSLACFSFFDIAHHIPHPQLVYRIIICFTTFTNFQKPLQVHIAGIIIK